MGIKDLLNGVVMENGVVDYGGESKRIERMWEFYRDLGEIAANDLDSAWDYGEEIAAGVITGIVNSGAQVLEELLGEEYGDDHRPSEEYLDLMESREYELKNKCAALLPWEGRLIGLWKAGDREGLANTLQDMQYRMGKVFCDEGFWHRVA